ncbi:MAG: antitoxin [Acidimicrobiales bacterium]
MLDRRLQVLIDKDRWDLLQLEAESRRVSVSTLVREAIDQRFQVDAERRRAAFQSLLDAEPMEVPDDPRDLKREIADARAARFE